MSLNRRSFLHLAGAGSVVSLASCSDAPEEAATPVPNLFSKPLGFQMYTLRYMLAEGIGDIFERVAAAGYTEIEAVQSTGANGVVVSWDSVADAVRGAGLNPTSSHVSSQIITGAGDVVAGPSTVEESAEWGAEHGFSWLVMPYVPDDQRGDDRDHYLRLAETLNNAAEIYKAAGIRFAYHNHAFEFGPVEDTTPMQILLEATDPDLVKIELDVFWTSIAGLDPAEWIRTHPGRAKLLHLKDKPANAPTQFAEGVASENFKEVGSGVLDFPDILEAAAADGMDRYVVEQDQTSGDAVESLAQSAEYLRGIEL
jgi:sugar phosphate isomerase/epimerase